MALTRPTISWEAIITESAPHTTLHNYTCRVTINNPNDPGYGQLAVGYYLVDNAGYIFEIKEINYGSDSEVVRVYNLLEVEATGPYNLKIGYIYSSLYQAAIVAQAKLNRLDESAEDFIRSLGVNPGYIDGVVFNPDYVEGSNSELEQEGAVHWNSIYNTLDLHTGYGSILQVGQEIHIKVYNDTGAEISDGTAVYPTGSYNGIPTIGKAITDTHETVAADYGITTSTIANNDYGFVTWFGKVRGIDTSSLVLGAPAYISSTVAGELTATRPSFPSYAIQIGIVFKVDPTEGEIFVTSRDDIYNTLQNFWNGVFRESFDFLVTSNGTTITGSLSPSNGHDDMTMIFSDGFTMLDTNPAATITLTPGTSTVPQINYVYIPKSTKVLTVSTSDWTTEEHIKVATILLRDAATTQTDGALRNQNWNDHIQDTTTNQGHLSHIGQRIRALQAEWDTGAEASLTGTPTNLYVSNTSGKVYQMHLQTFPALDMATGDDIHIVNDSVSPYRTTTNLNDITDDSEGNTLNNKWFSLVIWGVANKTGESSHIMCNLPSGSYLTEVDAVNDVEGYSNYTIPKVFKGTGFLIARFTIRKQSANFTYNSGVGYQDLRGFIPNSTAGSGAGSSGITTFTGLTDTPSSYTSNANKLVAVNATETALEFIKDIKLDSITEFTLDAGVIVENVTLKDGGITLGTGATVDTIETTLTNDDTHLPTSGAVWDSIQQSALGFINGSGDTNRIAVFSDSNTLTSYSNFQYTTSQFLVSTVNVSIDSTGTFEVSTSGNVIFSLDSNNYICKLGDVDGGDGGNFLYIESAAGNEAFQYYDGASYKDIYHEGNLVAFTATTSGLVPNPGGSTGRFLKDDGTWASASGVTLGSDNQIPIMNSAGTDFEYTDLRFHTKGLNIGTYTSQYSTAPYIILGNSATSTITFIADATNRAEIAYANVTDTLSLRTVASGTAYNNNLVVKAGKVGIQESNPSYTLDVDGTGRFTSTLYLGTTTPPVTDTGSLNALVYDPSTGEIKQRAITGGGGVDWGTATNKYIVLGSASGDIESSSNLSWISSVLSVNGELNLLGTLNHDGTYVGFFGATPVVQQSTLNTTGQSASATYDTNTRDLIDANRDAIDAIWTALNNLGLIYSPA